MTAPHGTAFEARARQASVLRFNAAQDSLERRAAAGLVSVSTSGFAALPTAFQWSGLVIKIDPQQARITRLRKGVGVGAKCLLNLADVPSTNNVMVTLTYDLSRAAGAFGCYWQPRHVSDYLRSVRGWFKDRCPEEKLRYVWVAELQQRGVLHYHVVFFLPAGVRMPQADRRGWWPHGMSNTLKSTSPVAYLMKYASKVESKNVGGFPRGARISGVGGLCRTGRAIRRWCLWPSYVQGNASVADQFRPADGGGYTNVDSGEHLASEFAPTGGGFGHFIRIGTTYRKIEAHGPFNWLRPPGVALH